MIFIISRMMVWKKFLTVWSSLEVQFEHDDASDICRDSAPTRHLWTLSSQTRYQCNSPCTRRSRLPFSGCLHRLVLVHWHSPVCCVDALATDADGRLGHPEATHAVDFSSGMFGMIKHCFIVC